jgi:hypothetical protein
MLSLQTLTMIEALLMSKAHPAWGEFMTLAQVIGEVQQAKQALMASRVQPAVSPTEQPAARIAPAPLAAVPNGAEPPKMSVPPVVGD